MLSLDPHYSVPHVEARQYAYKIELKAAYAQQRKERSSETQQDSTRSPPKQVPRPVRIVTVENVGRNAGPEAGILTELLSAEAGVLFLLSHEIEAAFKNKPPRSPKPDEVEILG